LAFAFRVRVCTLPQNGSSDVDGPMDSTTVLPLADFTIGLPVRTYRA
jgi:hypothetical protein